MRGCSSAPSRGATRLMIGRLLSVSGRFLRRPARLALRALGLFLGRPPGGLPGARLLDLRRQLLELLGERGAEALHRGALAVAGEVEFLGELLLGELLDRRVGRPPPPAIWARG